MDIKANQNAHVIAQNKKTAADATHAVDARATQRISQVNSVLTGHSQVLNYHTQAIDTNSRMIAWANARVDEVEGRLDSVEERISRAEKKVAKLNRNISGFMAQSAAMSSLITPMTPGKFSIAAAVGASGPAQAFAVGAGARLDEVWSAKASAAYDNVSRQITGGVGVGMEF